MEVRDSRRLRDWVLGLPSKALVKGAMTLGPIGLRWGKLLNLLNLFFFFSGAEDRTQGFAPARQALYH